MFLNSINSYINICIIVDIDISCQPLKGTYFIRLNNLWTWKNGDVMGDTGELTLAVFKRMSDEKHDLIDIVTSKSLNCKMTR